MFSWNTRHTSRSTDAHRPLGSIDIRLLPNLPSGEITHAQMTSQSTSKPAFMEKVTEFFFILEGEGQLWRRSGRKKK